MDKDKLLQFRITAVTQETTNAKTYSLKLVNRRSLPFRPGQFLTFIIQTERQELRRSYSILTLPEEPLKITVKKVENGAISRYILQNWKEGATVYSLEPAGRFTASPQKKRSRDIFCFAAGSGIVPVLPQIRFLLKEEPQSTIHLIYSNKNEEDTLFLNQLEEMASQHRNFELILRFSDPLYRHSEQGRLSNLTVEPLINSSLKFNRTDALFLLCGPFAYMRMLLFTIGLMHFRKENIMKENFIPEIMRAGQARHRIFPDETIQLIVEGETHKITIDSGNNILDSALKHGFHLPYSCKGGVCGTCAVKCMSGSVYMSINEVLTDADIKQGWVLTCTGYPEDSKVVLDCDSR